MAAVSAQKPPHARARRTVARLVAAVVAITAVMIVAACAAPSGNDDDVVDQGYLSGDGSVRTWPADQRSEPVVITGTDADGEPVDTGAWLGKVVVINTWYAACPPCRAEAPGLVDTAIEYAGDVQFLGINSTDDAATAKAFERTFDVPYPSLMDDDASAIATLQGVVPIQATPTTVILDSEGRVAARVLGEVEVSTLRGLLDEVLGYAPAAGGPSASGSPAP